MNYYTCASCNEKIAVGQKHICYNYNNICLYCGKPFEHHSLHSCDSNYQYPYINTLPDNTPKSKLPHVCPVCGGNGLVSNGFYSTPHMGRGWPGINSGGETCRSCQGTGVVWESKL